MLLTTLLAHVTYPYVDLQQYTAPRDWNTDCTMSQIFLVFFLAMQRIYTVQVLDRTTSILPYGVCANTLDNGAAQSIPVFIEHRYG